MDQQFVVQQFQVALAADGVQNSESLTEKIEATRAEIDNVGSTITYSKGASVLRMLELTFGTDLFNSALREYLKARYDCIYNEIFVTYILLSSESKCEKEAFISAGNSSPQLQTICGEPFRSAYFYLANCRQN